MTHNDANENASRETPAVEKSKNVSRETIENNVTVNMDVDKIAKKLDVIARRLETIPEDEENGEETLKYFNKKNDKCLRGRDGHKLLDEEIYKVALDKIAEYEGKTGIRAPISPEFKTYMEDYVKEVGGGIKTADEFKRERIYREVDLSQIQL